MSDGTTTIKYGLDRNDQTAPWNVFTGTVADRKAGLIEAFGWDPVEVAEWTLNQLTVRATQEAQGHWAARAKLGASVIEVKKEAPAPQPEPAQSAPQTEASDPWTQAEKAASTAGPAPGAGQAESLVDIINKAQTTKQLSDLWRANKDAWGDTEQEAAKARKAQLA